MPASVAPHQDRAPKPPDLHVESPLINHQLMNAIIIMNHQLMINHQYYIYSAIGTQRNMLNKGNVCIDKANQITLI